VAPIYETPYEVPPTTMYPAETVIPSPG
jgi:hypothetical protein